MEKIKLSISIPVIHKDYDVDLPQSTTGKRLYEALLARVSDLNVGGPSNAMVWELFSKRAQKRIYPDCKDMTLEQIGVVNGDTVIMKQNIDAG